MSEVHEMADWSNLPKDIYVVSAKSHGDIAFDVTCCSVPMVTAPEVRYTRADLIADADMLAALAPFAAVAEHDIGQDEDDADLFHVMSERNARAPRLTVGHLRSARAAIARARGDQS